MSHLQPIIFLRCEDCCLILGPFPDAEKIKDQVTYLHSSNKSQRKQNSTLNDVTSDLSQFLTQPYIILSIVTV